MASVNKVILVGNLGKDPELRYTPGGQAVCDLRIATTESFTSRDGDKKESTEWHNVVVWGKQAESCSQYLAKGRQVYVEGRLRTRSWEDKSGQKRYSTEVVAVLVQFLGGGSGERRAPGLGAGAPAGRSGAPDRERQQSDEPPPEDMGAPPSDDDIPF
jgi:single-strand DNA-binding protein